MADRIATSVEVLVLVVALLASSAKWLRVAQREHYEPGRATRFARMWLTATPLNLGLGSVTFLAAVLGWVAPEGWGRVTLIAAAAVAAILWPVGFPAPWARPRIRATGRLKRLTVVLAVLVIVVCVLVRAPERLMLLPLVMAPMTDLALALTRPLETRLGQRFVSAAQRKLARHAPTVVAITGSYGKTSTKNYLAHLAGPSSGVVASPASFNNLMGLARSVNERLHPGDRVFVAEMGTYGPGEIRRLCSLFPPDIAAITTIGEAHLERMGDRSTVARAKAEITETARTVVLNVDSPELEQLAGRLEAHKTVLRVSGGLSDAKADVTVRADPAAGLWWVNLDARAAAASLPSPPAGHTGNLAVALGLAVSLGLDRTQLLERMQHLPTADHRAEIHSLPSGVTVIDDTYNSNPVGAEAALRTAAETAAPGGTVWVITPGMVELGSVQRARNEQFGIQVGALPNGRLIVTHRVNRDALRSGALSAGAESPTWYPSRSSAATRVLADARAGDVVLFENDLPDHYP